MGRLTGIHSNIYRSGNPDRHERRRLRKKTKHSKAGAKALGLYSLFKQVIYDATTGNAARYTEAHRKKGKK
jgi:hypothetical protein